MPRYKVLLLDGIDGNGLPCLLVQGIAQQGFRLVGRDIFAGQGRIRGDADQRTFEAKEAFRFIAVGNAGGLSMKLNNLDLPPLGRMREVVKDKVFDRGTLQELQSAIHKST